MQIGKYKYLVAATQLFLIAGSCYLLYSKLSTPQLNVALKAALQALAPWHLVILLGLSICFWCLDTNVWRIILSPFTSVSFGKALRYNMIAQTAGILTPLLVGEYGLRSVLLRNEVDSRQNTLVTLAYQLMKVATRIIIGVLAGLLFMLSGAWSLISLVVTVGLLIGGAIAIKRLLKAVAKNKYANKLIKGANSLDFSQLRTKRALLPASLLFLAFSLQTALLIFWLDNKGDFFQVWLMVILTYSITSFLPPLSIFDPLAKSAVGALLYTEFASPNVMLFAFTATWVINRGVPAIISSLLFKRFSNRLQETARSTM